MKKTSFALSFSSSPTQTPLFGRIGFSKKESTIYISLIQNGPSTVSDLMRNTKMYRPAIYSVLPGMIEKGIVSIAPKGKQKLYVAESPSHLRPILDEADRGISKEILDLEEQYRTKNKAPLVTYSKGRKGIIAAYSDMVHSLKKGETYYRYSSASVLNRERYIPKDYRQVRDAKQLERLVITNEPTKRAHKDRLGRVIKVIPSDFDLFENDIAQLIYGNKVAIIDYNTKTTIIIENPIIAKFQKKIFKLLFDKL
jgi:sugar-specific transcriptional regulator TrmB